jgi:hypothetical protein
MPKPSLAESFFDEIRNAPDKIAFLSALANPARPTFEEEWLEFKQAPDLTDVQHNWSKALSGFANTGGGVLIWGIEAKKDSKTHIDCASAVSLIANPAALKSRLMQLHHQATDPPVLGIEVEQYADSSGSGFVVCFVPESGFKPHRAEQDGKKQFYLRAGDDFVVMPVAVLRSMFYPQASPNLQVETSFLDGIEAAEKITWSFRIHNKGTATAKDVCLWIKPSGFFAAPHPGRECFMDDIDRERGVCVACKLPIHPGTWRHVMALDETHLRVTSIDNHDADFTFRIFASDCEPQASHVRFGRVEFVNGDPMIGIPMEMPTTERGRS